VTLRLATAGESHGPALVAILSGLPAGLVLDRDAIDADLRRRQEGYGRSPRQRIEQDRVEVLAGLRHGRTLGTPLALVVSNRDHENWQWGMSPWPPEGEATGKGTKAVTVPRPGHADLAGALKFGLADTRDALERASARHTAAAVAAGSVCKALLGTISIEVEGRVATGDLERRIDDARADRDTVGGVVEVRAGGVPPGLGSYATKEERLDARLAAALMGIQAVKGVEIGDGFALAELRGSQAHDEIGDGLRRSSNRAGGIEAGVSNGEEIVVRAGMKPLPTLMRPLQTVDLDTGEPAEALVERSDVAAVEALAVVAEAAVAFELARAAREKFGGDALGDFVSAWRGYLDRIPWQPTR
jgi:chorismate synthase